MMVNQVSVELNLPPIIKDVREVSATIIYKPNVPGSTRVFLPTTDLNLEQLRLISDFVCKLSLFGDKAKELVDNIILKE